MTLTYHTPLSADEQRACTRQVCEDVARHVHSREGHRHGVLADCGVCAHALGNRKAVLKDSLKRRANRGRLLRHAERRLHLTQDLRLAQHHGIQAAGHLDEVLDGRLIAMDVAVVAQFGLVDVMVVAQPGERYVGRSAVLQQAEDLRAVAGAENDQFGDTLLGMGIAQCVEHLLVGNSNLLPHREGG